MIKTMEQWLTGKKLLVILTITAAAWFSFTAVMTVLRYRLNYASAYDFGIFSQMYYYMDKGLSPLTTCERDGLLSHFAVHLSPVFYLLLPFYKLVPGAPAGASVTYCHKRDGSSVSFDPVIWAYPPADLVFRSYVLLLPRLYGRMFL